MVTTTTLMLRVSLLRLVQCGYLVPSLSLLVGDLVHAHEIPLLHKKANSPVSFDLG